MRRWFAGLAVATIFLGIVLPQARADKATCPDTSKVQSGTPFCAPENYDKNFPSIAFCDSPTARRDKVCPAEAIESHWGLSKQGDVGPYQRDVDGILALLDAKTQPAPDKEEALKKNRSPYARMEVAELRKILCIRGHQILAHLEPRQKAWKRMSGGKWALDTLKEVDAQVKASAALESYCKEEKGSPDAGAKATQADGGT